MLPVWMLLSSLFEGWIGYATLFWIRGEKVKWTPVFGLTVFSSVLMILSSYYFTEIPFLEGFYRSIGAILIIYLQAYLLVKRFRLSFLMIIFSVALIIVSQLISIPWLSFVMGINLATLELGMTMIGFHMAIYIHYIVIAYTTRHYYARLFAYIVDKVSKLSKGVVFALFMQFILAFLIMAASVFLLTDTSLFDNNDLLPLFMIVGIGVTGVLSTLFLLNALRHSERKAAFNSQDIMLSSYDQIKGDISGFWHSYANIMQVIDILVSTEHLEVSDVKDALREFSQAHHSDNMGLKMRIADIGHTVLACVLSSKLSYAESLGVKLEIDVEGVGAIDLNMRDLTEVLGILLDNAIEASHFSERVVRVSGLIDPSKFNLLIENRYSSNESGIMKYGKSNGIGKSRVASLLGKQKHVQYGIEDKEYHYRVTLEVKNRNEDPKKTVQVA